VYVTCFFTDSSSPPAAVVFFCLVGGCVATEPVLFTGGSPPCTVDSEKRLHVRGVVRSRIMYLPAHSGPRCELPGFSWEQAFVATRPKCTRPGRDPVVCCFQCMFEPDRGEQGRVGGQHVLGTVRAHVSPGGVLIPPIKMSSSFSRAPTVAAIVQWLVCKRLGRMAPQPGHLCVWTARVEAGAPSPRARAEPVQTGTRQNVLGLEGDLWRHRHIVL